MSRIEKTLRKAKRQAIRQQRSEIKDARKLIEKVKVWQTSGKRLKPDI